MNISRKIDGNPDDDRLMDANQAAGLGWAALAVAAAMTAVLLVLGNARYTAHQTLALTVAPTGEKAWSCIASTAHNLPTADRAFAFVPQVAGISGGQILQATPVGSPHSTSAGVKGEVLAIRKLQGGSLYEVEVLLMQPASREARFASCQRLTGEVATRTQSLLDQIVHNSL